MSFSSAKTICRKCRLEYQDDALFCPNCGTPRVRDDPADPMVGATIGERYILLERIGQGGSGTIYRAEHITLRRKVAVKVLHHELSRDDLAIERFRREATTVGQIENDHIVEIFDFGRTGDGRLYLAMELLEGETLADLIEREGQLDIERAVDILIQLGETLMEAHAMGYIHRDLRPRNVFLAIRRGKSTVEFVKLLDFGLAKLVEKEGEAASTSLGMTFGDPHYMSPEQARGDSLDRRADIYSLGCIAYEMLVGEPPFVGGKVFDILTRHVEATPVEPLERRSDLPGWLDQAVTRMLAKRADQRFITVYRLIEALRQGQGSGHVMADDVARRMETIPPTSVSEAMARLGARAPADMAVEVARVPDGAAPAPQEPEIELPIDAEIEPAVPAAPAPPVAPAGEQRVGAATALGLGVAPAGAAAGGKRAQLAHAGAPRAAPNAASGGLSAAWYADGEAMAGDGADVADSQKGRLDRARRHSPSKTGIVVVDDEYAEPRRHPWRLAVIISGALLLGGAGAYALFSKKTPEERAGVAEAEEPRAPRAAAVETSTSARAPVPTSQAAATGGAAPAAAAAPAVAGAASEQPAAESGRSAPERSDTKVSPIADEAAAPAAAGSRSKLARADGGGPARPAGGRRASAGAAQPRGRFDDIGRDVAGDAAAALAPTSPQTVASADASKAEFYARLGDRDLANGDFLGAATSFNKARELDANNPTAILGLGEIALSQGSTESAVAHLRRAARLRPGSARAHTLLGEALLASGRKQQAAVSFRRALKIDPQDGRARSGLDEAGGPPSPDDDGAPAEGELQ